ncbi:MAG: hypothetical protein A2Z72_07770, partial [Omnitrophica bacterium RBG_13_46_9]
MKLILYLNKINQLTDGGISNADSAERFSEALLKAEYLKEEKTKEDTAPSHEPAAINLYFNQVEHLERHIFAIPVSVTKRGVRSDYTFIFSTIKSDDAGYSVFGCLTLEEFKEKRNAIETWARRDGVPERNKTDRAAINRYIQQETNIDSVLRFAHDNGLAMTPEAQVFNYKETVRGLLNTLGITVEPPANGLKPIEERGFFIVRETDAVKSMLRAVTVPDKDGIPHLIERPWAHSSNYAVHVFLPENLFDAMMNETDVLTAYREKATSFVDSVLAHEIGVMLGLPILPGGTNEVSRRYQEALGDFQKPVRHDSFRKKFEPLQMTIVDLDTNLKTRDYAMGENKKFPQNVYYFGVSGIKPEKRASVENAIPFLREFLEESEKAGLHFTGVEMHGPNHELTKRSLPGVMKLLNSYGVRIATISPEIFRDFDPKKGALSSRDSAERAKAVDLVKQTIDLAVMAECPKVNLWPGLDMVTEAERKERFEIFVDTLKVCLEYAHEKGVMLTIEPVPLSKIGETQPIIYDIDQAVDLYFELKENHAPVENFGIIMDLSHQILADSSVPDIQDRQISGLAAWAKCLHRIGIKFWIHANDNYDFEAYTTGKARAITNADQDLNIGAEHAADIQALFAYLAEIGYDEVISFDLSPATKSAKEAAQRFKDNIETCDRLYKGNETVELLAKF